MPNGNWTPQITPTPQTKGVGLWNLVQQRIQAREQRPWHQKALETIAKPFEWVQEHLEEPWAATLTAPFSPELAWEEGETWLEHEKREYAAWEAPKFVKGISEFSMPLWWLPYFGWAAKGASFIPRIGGSLIKGIRSAESVLALPITVPLRVAGKAAIKVGRMPAIQKMRADVFKADTFRAFAEKLSVLPGFRTAAGVLNPSAIASGEAQIGRTLHGGLREVADNLANHAVSFVERHGTEKQIAQLFGFDDMMKASRVAPKVKGSPTNWFDIATNPKAYRLTPAQKAYIDDYHKVIDAVVVEAERNGVRIPKLDLMEGLHYTPRIWQGRLGVLDTRTGIWRPVGTAHQPEAWEKIVEVPLRARIPGARIGVRTSFELPRCYEFAEEAIARGVTQPMAPNSILNIYTTGMYRRMADTIAAESLRPLGRVIGEFISGGTRAQARELGTAHAALRRLEQVIPRVSRGERLPAQTLKSIGVRTPEFATRLNEAIALRGGNRSKSLTALRKEVTAAREVAFRDLQGIRSIARRELSAVRGGVPGWRAVGQPFAAGRLFPEAIANDLNKMLADRGMPILTKLSNINALSRFMVTGFDFGAGLIQGVPLLMSSPLRWGKAMGISIKSFFDPTLRARYLSNPENVAVLRELIPEGLLIGSSEFMEAAVRSPAKWIDSSLKLVGSQRWATSFNTFGDVARIEMGKALLPMVKREGQSLKELSAFLNEMTGVLSSRALGVGATQREIEGAILLFAPRYFRANIALWADMTRGGLRGALARDALVSMLMGGFFWYYGVCKALGQEPNLNPSSGKFMTVELFGQHVGLGSMQVAGLRLLGNIYRTATEDPEGFISLDSRDNPLMRFVRSRVAPITGASWDIVAGKTFIGEPIDTPLRFGKEVITPRMLPFWLSGYISDYPQPGPGGMAEIFGARTWPLQLWEKRDELRDRLARAEYNKPWYSSKEEEGVNELQRGQLEEKYDELRQATEATLAQRVERGGASEQMWHTYQEERKRARAAFEDTLWKAQNEVNAGLATGYDFRQKVTTASAQLRAMYEHIEGNPAYAEIMEYFAQPMTSEQMRDTPIEDIAFDQYMALMYSPDMEDQYGNYRWDKAEQIRQIIVAQYGDEILNYIEARLSQGKDVPPLMAEYYKAQRVMRPYWRIRDEMIAIMGEPRTIWQEQKLNALVSRMRKRMRLQNPELERYYQMFYVRG